MKRQEEHLTEKLNLTHMFHALWKRAWAIVLAAVLFGAAAYSYTYFRIKPTYTAETLLYVNNSDIPIGSTEIGISAADLAVAQRLVDTYVVILETRTTLNEVIKVANLPYSYGQLKGMISAAAVNETEIFSVRVVSSDPHEAELIANTIGKVLPSKISSIVDGSSVRIVDAAVVPSGPSSPDINGNTTMGALIGILVACAVIILVDYFDDKIRDAETLTRRYDIPLLSVIPDMNAARAGKAKYYYKSDYETQVEEAAEKEEK